MIQVELHDRSDAKLKILTGAKNAAYHPVLNQDGSGLFRIHRADPDFVALNILNGGIDGYIVHLFRKGPYEAGFVDRFSFVVEAVNANLGQQEDAGAWFTVSGRGTLCLLEGRLCWPPGFNGANASSITNQLGQAYVSKSGGFIMDAELDRSASRFTPTITHTVQSTTVNQSVTLRFDDLRLLHDALVKSGPMDAQMVGLDYQAVNVRGTDKSATVQIQMAAQDSLLGITLERDASKVLNWIVAQGTGEGINAKLAVQTDAAAVAALRRREGFVDDRQINDQTQLALDAAGALALSKRADQRITTRFIDSPHTQLYRDFDLGDTVKLNVQPLGFSQNYRVVGYTVADQDSEVEDLSLDLNSMRAEYLLKLVQGTVLPTVKSVNILNRAPQGATFNDILTYPDNCNATFPFHFIVFIPSNVLQLNYAKLSFFLQAFRSYNAYSGTAIGANNTGHTHTSAAHSHSHGHTIPIGAGPFNNAVGQSAAGGQLQDAYGPTTAPVNTDATSTTPAATGGESATHTHNINITSTLGIYEDIVATGVTVIINGTDRTSALGGGSGFTVDQTELEIGSYLTIGVKNTIDLTPTGLGRILGHLRLTGYIQST